MGAINEVTDPPAGFKYLPVEVIRDLAERYERRIVLIHSFFTKDGQTVMNATSYGVTAEEKEAAGHLAELCNKALGYGEVLPQVYADFRDPSEGAKSRAEAEDLERRLAQADELVARLVLKGTKDVGAAEFLDSMDSEGFKALDAFNAAVDRRLARHHKALAVPEDLGRKLRQADALIDLLLLNLPTSTIKTLRENSRTFNEATQAYQDRTGPRLALQVKPPVPDQYHI